MFHDQDLFLKAETHWAAKAARGRVDAIDNAKDLHWAVTATSEGVERSLTFDRAPTFDQVVRAMRASGLWGEVHLRSITVGRARQRRLILMPWQRVRAPAAQAVAAE